MGATSVQVPLLTGLLVIAGCIVVWLILRIVLAPVAKVWRERPAVVYDERSKRWRAAPRLGK